MPGESDPTGGAPRRSPGRGSGGAPPIPVVVAAGTARGAGGLLALRAVCIDLAARPGPVLVQVPRRPDPAPLAPGPRYRSVTRLGAVARELAGPSRRGGGVYVGLSDRLPLAPRAARLVMVAQNPHLYGPPTAGLRPVQRARIAMLSRWARRSARRADLIVTASDATRQEVIGSTGIDAGRVVVRPIPVLASGPGKDVHADAVRRIALVGDHYGYKRFDWALEEIQRWAATRDARVGVEHAGGVFERPALRRFREAALRSGSVVVTEHGRIGHEEAMAVLVGADLFVFPSERESFGLPLAEALALGVPAVCRDLAAFREIGGDAPVYFSGAPGSLAAALVEVESRPVREAMSVAGTTRWGRGGGWNVVDRHVGP